MRSTGFYRNKAKNIQAACRLIQTEFGGQVPQRMEQLLQLPEWHARQQMWFSPCLRDSRWGNGGYHVKRLSYRLGLTADTDPIRIERDLMRLCRSQSGKIHSAHLPRSSNL